MIALCLLQSSCLQSTRRSKELVLQIPLASDPLSLDPAKAADSLSLELVPLVYETLYEYSYLSDEYRIEPLLAAELPLFSADRKKVTIQIKKGIRFQDDAAFASLKGKGRELRAHDFIYSLKRLYLPSVQSPHAHLLRMRIVGLEEFSRKLASASKKDLPLIFTEPVAGLLAIDDYTLQITLNRAFPQITHLFAQSFTAPIARESIDLYGDENWVNSFHPIGTGPFILEDWKKGQSLTFKKNPQYHPDAYPVKGESRFKEAGYLKDSGKTLPFADRIRFLTQRDALTAQFEFSKGMIDIHTFPQVGNSDSPNEAKLVTDVQDSIYYLGFNMQDPLIGSKIDLRKAIHAAISRTELISQFDTHRGIPADSFLPLALNQRPVNNSVKNLFDLDQARALLDKSGYPLGKGLSPLRLDMNGNEELHRKIGQYLAAALAQIGIQVTVILNTYPDFLEKIRDGKTQLIYNGWTLDYPDAENVYQLFYSKNFPPGLNDSRFENRKFDTLYEKLTELPNGEERGLVIAEMESILLDELPWAPLFYPQTSTLVQAWLLNYRPSQMHRNRYKYLRSDNEIKSRILGPSHFLTSLFED